MKLPSSPYVSAGTRPRLADVFHFAASPLARDTTWLFAGFSLRVAAQGVGFVVLARALGPSNLGSFSAVLAVATLLSPFVELGAYSLAVRDVAAGVAEQEVAGNTLALTVVSLPLALVALLAVSHVAFPRITFAAVALIGLGNLLGARLTSLFRGIYMGRGEVRGAASMEAAAGVCYALGALGVAARSGSLEEWAWVYCAQSVGVGVVGAMVVVSRFGRPAWALQGMRHRLREGIHFGLATVAQSANSEADKALLARLASLESAGVYSASSRVLAVAMAPAMAFFGATYRRFFRSGSEGLSRSRRLAFRVAPATLAYGIVASSCVALAAPLISQMFGSGFSDSASALRWLAPLVAVQALTYPFLDALTGAGLQPLRAVAHVGTLSVGVSLNLLLDASLGWKGAVTASLVSQGTLLAFAVVASPWVARTMTKKPKVKNEG